MSPTLAVTTVPAYLRKRGLSNAADGAWAVRLLTGGVSGVVFSANDGARRFVVKQPLERLAVEDDWTAPRERILNEAKALDIIGRVVPVHSPKVLDIDETTLTITMEHAPEGWADWKSELLTDDVDAALASELGEMLGTIHTATSSEDWALPPDDGAAGFRALRIDPFHGAVVERLPGHAEQVQDVVARILSRHDCLVHGDFSPKNILVGPAGRSTRRFWLIDDEVSHRGDPVFDLAFFLSHLALKRIRASAPIKPLFDAAGSAFVNGYRKTGVTVDASDLSEQIGCLVLARVVGRSPVRYLDESQRQSAVILGGLLLNRAADYRFDHPLRIT